MSLEWPEIALILAFLFKLLVLSTLPCLVVGYIFGWLTPGLTLPQGIRRGIIVGLLTFAMSVGLFFIQGAPLIFLVIVLGMGTTVALCYWSSKKL